jgi:putative ABC transport system ATP-binding protein
VQFPRKDELEPFLSLVTQNLAPHTLLGMTTSVALQPAAQAHQLVKRYGEGDNEVVALNGVTVAFPSGQFTAIMGPSGSGKSTLMHCLAGLDAPTSGSVHIGSVDITTLNRTKLTELRGAKLGFIFQAFNLLPMLTAKENIELTARLSGHKIDKQWFALLVGALGLADRLDHRPGELSGGQQQRVAVARALLTRPTVVFADEPTGNLDSKASREVLQFLRTAVDSYGQTVVMVTHDPRAASVTDHVIILADGQIVHQLNRPTIEDINQSMQLLERV